MGRCSAVEPLEVVIKAINPWLPKDQAVGIYVQIIEAFEDYDCDCIGELAGRWRLFDKALKNCGYEID